VTAVCTFVRSCGDCGGRGLQVDGGVGGAVYHIRLEIGGVELGFVVRFRELVSDFLLGCKIQDGSKLNFYLFN